MRYVQAKPFCDVPRWWLAGAVVLCLSACGGGTQSISAKPVPLEGVQRFATGPIGTACNIHNRRTASQAKCGCVQSAANLTMSQSEQNRGVRYFAEPELLQQMKLSDSPANERFWYTWANFAETAEKLCSDL